MPGEIWESGFVRGPAGELILSESEEGTWQSGFLRDDEGRLITSGGGGSGGDEEPVPQGEISVADPFGELPEAHDLTTDGGWYLQANEERLFKTPNGVKIEIHEGDEENDTKLELAQFRMMGEFETGEEIWVRHVWRWLDSDTSSPEWETIHEWHDGGDGGGAFSPAVTFYRETGNKLKLAEGATGDPYFTAGTMEFGRWYELFYRIKFDETDGELEMYWNRESKGTFKGLTTHTGSSYLKIGNYREGGTAGNSVTEHRLLAVGTTKEIVLDA